MEEAETKSDETALAVRAEIRNAMGPIAQVLDRLNANDKNRYSEYEATAGALLRIEQSRKKVDNAVEQLPAVVARCATIERWLIGLAKALEPDKDDETEYPEGTTQEWAQSFLRWVRSGGSPIEGSRMTAAYREILDEVLKDKDGVTENDP